MLDFMGGFFELKTISKNKANNVRPFIIILAVVCFLVTLGLYWFSVADSWNFIAVLGVLIPLGVAIAYAHFSGKMSDRAFSLKVYPFVLGLFCLVFVFAIPPMSSPDEGHHFFSSYWLSDALTGDSSFDSGNSFPVRSDIVRMYEYSGAAIGSSGYRTVLDSFELFSSSSQVESMESFQFDFGSENSIAKIPTVLGITLARMLNLGPYPLFYLGRLFAAIFFVACATVAVRLAPIGKPVFMGVSLLPMTLQLAASYSYDCGIIAFCFIMIALLFRALLSREQIEGRELFSIVVMAAIVAPLKIVYAPILILFFFIPQKRFRSKRAAWASKIMILAAAVFSIVLFRLVSVANLVGSSGGGSIDHRGSEVGTFYSLHDLLVNPIGTLAMFLRTFDSMGDFYLSSMLGGLPGWLQANLGSPWFVLIGYIAVLLFVAQKSPDDKVDVASGVRIALVVAFLVMFIGISASMAIGWTFNTEPIIQGVQGRYFLPLLPAILLALRSSDVLVHKNQMDVCLTSMCFINICYIMRFAAMAFVLP